MTEQEAFDSFIITKLEANAALVALVDTDASRPAFYNTKGPDTSGVTKFVVFQAAAPLPDINPQGLEMQIATIRYTVLHVQQGGEYSYAAEAAINAALQGVSAVVEGWSIFCKRIRPRRFAQEIKGRQFRHIGAEYELEATGPGPVPPPPV